MRLPFLILTVLFALLMLAPQPRMSEAVTLPQFGDGSDGPRTYVSSTDDAPIDSQASGLFGSTALWATNAQFATGQRIMIHQGEVPGAGAWEINQIQSYTAGTGPVTTVNPLANDYYAVSQVLVLQEYTDFTVNAGVTVTAKAWNGSTGGIFAFLATGTVSIDGAINADGKGFRGATGLWAFNGVAGEGTTTEYNRDGGSVPTGNGGMGGHDVQHGSAGGGGNGTAGGDGSYEAPFNGTQGRGGLTAGASDLSAMVFGGGGGNTSVQGGNSFGGNGGGIIVLVGSTMTIGASGSVTSRGEAGLTDNSGAKTGGGGGAGGSIFVRSQTASLGTGRVVASGGSGGAGSNAGPGGAGGVGRIRIEYCLSLTGSTIPVASVALLDADADGIGDCIDNCPSQPNIGDVDCDRVGDIDEPPCDSNPLDGAIRPERIDGVFAGIDDDGDTLIDEALPSGSETYDCDGDGFSGNTERSVFSATDTRDDQNPCGSSWPPDFNDDHIVDILDVNMLAPPRFFASPPDSNYSVRYDIVPDGIIDISDVNMLAPPMFFRTCTP